jgi:hypothetical protein
MTEKRARYDAKYDATRKDVLISFRGTPEIKEAIENEAEHLNISKRDMLALAWKTYKESMQSATGKKPTNAIGEAHTNLAFKMICSGIHPHLSNRQIVEIIESGSEDKPLKTPVTKSQVEKYKSSLNRVKNVTGNNRGGRVPMYKEMPLDVFNAFVNGLTLYDFEDQKALTEASD